MTVAIIGNPGSETNAELAAAWAARGIDAVVARAVDAMSFLCPGDVALGRLDVRRSLDGVERGLLELVELERRGVLVLNRASALISAHDKLVTARLLDAAGVPHPEWVHVRTGDPLPELAPPLVVKPRFGSWGRDVSRCDATDDVRRLLDELPARTWFRRHGALVQRLVPPAGYDIRVLVASGNVVGGEERVAASGEWRTNISLGGSHRRTSITSAAASLASAAAAAVGMDVCGVDLLPAGDGYIVLEVNGAVDFGPAYSLPEGDVYDDLASALALWPQTVAALPSPVRF